MNQAVAGNVHEVLVIDLAKVDILFPTFVVADNDRFPDRFAGRTAQQNKEPYTHLVIDATSAFHDLGSSVSLFAMRLQTGNILVVHGIDAFQHALFDNHGTNPAGCRRKGNDIAKPNINNRRKQWLCGCMHNHCFRRSAFFAQ